MNVFLWPYLDILLSVAFLSILTFLYIDNKFTYWARKGVSTIQPSLIFGNIKEALFGRKNLGVLYQEIYEKFPEKPYIGYYEFQRPVLLLRDPEHIKTVLIKNFNCFYDNKYVLSEKNDLLYASNLFVLKGQRWKNDRSELAHCFTPNKLQTIPDIVNQEYKHAASYIDQNLKCIELSSLATRFTADLTVKWGWGLEGNAFKKSSIVRDMFSKLSVAINLTIATIILNPFFAKLLKLRSVHTKVYLYLLSVAINLTIATIILNPFFAKLLKLRIISKELTSFIKQVTGQCLEQEVKGNPSLVQTIFNIKRKTNFNSNKEELVENLSGHFTTLFLDSYETTGRTLAYVLYCLMQYPDIQDKVREEIMEINEEEATMGVFKRLVYMEMVILETLRHHPPLPYLGRCCTEKCSLGDLELQPGQDIIIPTLGLHNDPQYFPEPYKFNPEHFSADNKNSRPRCVDLSFGQGPRICIGMRYALISMKLFLYHLLRNYKLVPPENYKVKPIEAYPGSVFVYVENHELSVQFKKL